MVYFYLYSCSAAHDVWVWGRSKCKLTHDQFSLYFSDKKSVEQNAISVVYLEIQDAMGDN